MTGEAVPRPGLAAGLIIRLIRLYQLILSPLLGNCCRFYPSCSAYATEALREYGAFRGSLMTLRRIGKCHPFHPGGVDEVPGRASAARGPEPAREEPSERGDL